MAYAVRLSGIGGFDAGLGTGGIISRSVASTAGQALQTSQREAIHFNSTSCSKPSGPVARETARPSTSAEIVALQRCRSVSPGYVMATPPQHSLVASTATRLLAFSHVAGRRRVRISGIYGGVRPKRAHAPQTWQPQRRISTASVRIRSYSASVITSSLPKIACAGPCKVMSRARDLVTLQASASAAEPGRVTTKRLWVKIAPARNWRWYSALSIKPITNNICEGYLNERGYRRASVLNPGIG